MNARAAARGLALLLLHLSAGANAAPLPAFPGAEGAGAHAAGGRGGDVYHVVNLNSSGAGSLAEGLAGAPDAGRTIVFDVSGYAHIPGELRITKSRITIAGQTAPGEGFGLKDGTFWISGDDIVIRHLRFRAGHTADAVDFDSGSMTSILDHCSVQFGGDENLSTWSPPENLTFQHSINAWGLESHSCGGLWNTLRTTAHHCLWAHNHTRDPKARPDGLLDWINNVTFDYDLGFIMGDSTTPAAWKANVEGCYFVCPPGNTRSYALSRASLDRNGDPNFSLWLTNCLMDSNGNGILDGSDKGWSIATGDYAKMTGSFARTTGVPVTQDPPLTAYKKIVSQVGPLRLDAASGMALRDEVDTLLIGNLVAQRRNHVSDPSGTGASNDGFGALTSAPAPADTDRDGMPDYWEAALGFNPTLDDHNAVFPSSGGFITGPTFFPANTPAGYTRLEEYLHFLAIPHGVVARSTAADPTSIDVDCRAFTTGFTNAAVYGVTNVAGGSVSPSGPGGCLVRFFPTQDFSGRAGFDFTVRDADGSEWRQSCALLVTPSGVPRSLLWRGGAATNTWDTAATNWIDRGNAAAYSVGDSATFDDTGATNPPVLLSGTLLPGGVTVNAARHFAFVGSGSLAGAMALIKSGPGTLTLSNAAANTYAGGTLVDEGTLALANGATAGSGPIVLQGGGTLAFLHDYVPVNGVTVPSGESGTMNLEDRMTIGGALSGGGTLTLNVPRSAGDDGRDYLAADASAFAGRLNILGGGTAGAMPVQSSCVGFDLATVAIGNVRLNPQGTGAAVTYRIGALEGADSRAVLGGATKSSGATTWEVGGLGGDTVFAGQFQDGGAGTAALTKSGAGTLTLTGTSGHTGPTVISNGTLRVDGVIGASPVSTLSNAVLSGAGSLLGGAAVQAGGIVSPSAGPGAGGAGTLFVSNGLALNNAVLRFDLSASPGGTNDRISLQGGMLTMSGTQSFAFDLADGILGAGTYLLIDGGTNTSAAGVGLVHNLPSGTRQTFALQRPASGNGQCYVRLVVGGAAASLLWRGGDSSNAWDWAATTNWLNGAAPDRFLNFDAVTFDDSSTNGTVSVAGVVEPRDTVVSNVLRAYALGGGTIGGSGALTKLGTNTLTIACSNAFGGGTTLRSGTVRLADDTATAFGLGTGPVVFDGGTLAMCDNANSYNSATYRLVVPAGSSGTLWADSRCFLYGSLTGGGILNLRVPWVRTDLYGDWSAFTGTINLSSDADGGDLRLAPNYSFPGFPAAAVNLATRTWLYFSGIVSSGAGTVIPIGELSGAAGGGLLGGPTAGRILTWRVGGRNTDAVFAGRIAEQVAGGITVLEKTGAGAWTLTGSNTYAGGTTVRAGTLRVINAAGSGTGSGSVTVKGGARLEGSGTIAGPVTLEAGADLAPGAGTGVLAIGDDLSMAAGATAHFELGTNSDSVSVGGNLSLSGTLEIADAGGVGPGTYLLFSHGGELAWDGFALGAAPAGLLYAFDTNTPGRVNLVVSSPLSPFQQWQVAWFGNTNDTRAEAHADPDGDHADNEAEFGAGTNPTNAASVFRMIRATRQGDDLLLAWSAAGIRTNRLQVSTGLAGSPFADRGPTIILAQPGDIVTNWLDAGAATNPAPCFYRIRLGP